MSEELNQIMATGVKSWEQGVAMVEKLFTVARPEAVFSEPVNVENYTVITAAEVMVGMGFGYGSGAGSEGETAGNMGGGGGGGGGGASGGRPVAAIIVGPDGVRVEPVVDITKLALAFITALGGMFLIVRKMQQRGQV